MLVSFAVSSLKSRKKSVILTFLSLLISVSVLLSVEHIRQQAQQSFSRTISGVDLIVGAPGGQLNLLLYSVFRMGSPTNNIDIKSYRMLTSHDQVEWVIPVSLGDSHRGFRVMGTSTAYFEHYKYADGQPLQFAQGEAFSGVFDAVIGADVARQLNYQVDNEIVVAHGIGSVSFSNHEQSPFTVRGILAPTGTPVDKTVHVSLAGIEAMHLPGARLAQVVNSPDTSLSDLQPTSLTAAMVGLKSKFATFMLQREISNYGDDRLMAILPGVAMAELWQMMGTVENLLRVISALVLISSLFGLATMLLASMQQREREIAVLRVLGAGAGNVFLLILTEAFLITLAAVVSAVMLTMGLFFSTKAYLAGTYGLFISPNLLNYHTAWLVAGILLAALLTALLPAWDAYRSALHSRL